MRREGRRVESKPSKKERQTIQGTERLALALPLWGIPVTILGDVPIFYKPKLVGQAFWSGRDCQDDLSTGPELTQEAFQWDTSSSYLLSNATQPSFPSLAPRLMCWIGIPQPRQKEHEDKKIVSEYQTGDETRKAPDCMFPSVRLVLVDRWRRNLGPQILGSIVWGRVLARLDPLGNWSAKKIMATIVIFYLWSGLCNVKYYQVGKYMYIHR